MLFWGERKQCFASSHVCVVVVMHRKRKGGVTLNTHTHGSIGCVLVVSAQTSLEAEEIERERGDEISTSIGFSRWEKEELTKEREVSQNLICQSFFLREGGRISRMEAESLRVYYVCLSVCGCNVRSTYHNVRVFLRILLRTYAGRSRP